MGMDVFGIKPTSERGEYFRNNVWYWHPLWDYCCTIDESLIDKVPQAHNNSGDGLKAVEARKLGFQLQEELSTGRAEQYVTEYEKERLTLPKQDCKFCDENGQRQWEHGLETCNACQGTKKVDSWEAHYPMSVENIKEFSEFLLDCGGFRIC
jgi:hypothetical protein